MKIIDVMNTKKELIDDLFKDEIYKNYLKKKWKQFWDVYQKEESLVGRIFLIDKTKIDSDMNFDQMLSEIKTDYVEITDKKTRCIKKGELQEEINNSKYDIFVIREYILADVCGYAYFTSKKNIYVESCKGGFYAFFEGVTIPSFYILNCQNQLIKKKEREANEFFVFNGEHMKWEQRHVEIPQQQTVSMEKLVDITNLLKHVGRRNKAYKIAWVIENNKLRVFDVFLPIGQVILE